MVSTDFNEDRLIGHTRRDIAGLFTPTATAIRQYNDQEAKTLDAQILSCASRVLVQTMLSWRGAKP